MRVPPVTQLQMHVYFRHTDLEYSWLAKTTESRQKTQSIRLDCPLESPTETPRSSFISKSLSSDSDDSLADDISSKVACIPCIERVSITDLQRINFFFKRPQVRLKIYFRLCFHQRTRIKRLPLIFDMHSSVVFHLHWLFTQQGQPRVANVHCQQYISHALWLITCQPLPQAGVILAIIADTKNSSDFPHKLVWTRVCLQTL